MLGLARYYREPIFLGPIGWEELAQLLLKRHRVSGYALRFEPSAEAAASRRYLRLRSERARQDFLRELFFRRLAETAEGNIELALLLWLDGVRRFDRGEVSLSPGIGLDQEAILALPSEDHFTLAALVLHEHLDAEGLARVFEEPVAQSMLRLSRLANAGILQEAPAGYSVHPLVYRSAVRVLRSRNLVK